MGGDERVEVGPLGHVGPSHVAERGAQVGGGFEFARGAVGDDGVTVTPVEPRGTSRFDPLMAVAGFQHAKHMPRQFTSAGVQPNPIGYNVEQQAGRDAVEATRF